MSSDKTLECKISMYISAELLAKLDLASKIQYCSRSNYIRAAIVQRLQDEQTAAAIPAVSTSGQNTPNGEKPVVVVEQTEAEFLKALEERFS